MGERMDEWSCNDCECNGYRIESIECNGACFVFFRAVSLASVAVCRANTYPSHPISSLLSTYSQTSRWMTANSKIRSVVMTCSWEPQEEEEEEELRATWETRLPCSTTQQAASSLPRSPPLPTSILCSSRNSAHGRPIANDVFSKTIKRMITKIIRQEPKRSNP